MFRHCQSFAMLKLLSNPFSSSSSLLTSCGLKLTDTHHPIMPWSRLIPDIKPFKKWIPQNKLINVSLQWPFNCCFLLELEFVEGGKPLKQSKNQQKAQPTGDVRSWLNSGHMLEDTWSHHCATHDPSAFWYPRSSLCVASCLQILFTESGSCTVAERLW